MDGSQTAAAPMLLGDGGDCNAHDRSLVRTSGPDQAAAPPRLRAGCTDRWTISGLAPITWAEMPTISGSGPVTILVSLGAYGNDARKCCMQFRRARFLSSDLMRVHGASAMSV